MIVLQVLLFIVAGAVVFILARGLFGLARGADPAHSNAMMRWRIKLQALALVLLFLLFVFSSDA
ncbi:MAG: twin transmembrane helix small protein [Alphaproteobacteria bacterium]|nr:twin transmembrane helix small protein [Alphaproteobacteria bacterium]